MGSCLAGSEVERHLDGATLVLRGERRERVTPMLEPEGVREHAVEVDAAVPREVEVVLDSVLAHTPDLLEAERVRAHPGDLFEVQRRPFPPRRPVHSCLDERSPSLEQTHANLEGLWPTDGVV